MVVAKLRLSEAQQLANADNEASTAAGGELPPAKARSLFRKPWAALLAALDVLEPRLAAATLLPGACREEEVSFSAHRAAAMAGARGGARGGGRAPPDAAELRGRAAFVGYDAAMHAAATALALMRAWPCPPESRSRAQRFVLALLDAAPAARMSRFTELEPANLFSPGRGEPAYMEVRKAKGVVTAAVGLHPQFAEAVRARVGGGGQAAAGAAGADAAPS